jgi:hypothetical protein
MRSHRIVTALLAAHLCLIFGTRQAQGQCDCSIAGRTLVFSHEFGGGLKLIICGESSGKAGNASNITVVSCPDKRILLTIRPEETDLGLNDFRFEARAGSVIIQQLITLPGGPDWAWAAYPFLEKEVSPSNGRLEISVWSEIFVVPKKSQQEIGVFLVAYDSGFERAGSAIDCISKLMLCAMNGSREAERKFLNFPNDHREIFDGAVAESYFERLDFYRTVHIKEE